MVKSIAKKKLDLLQHQFFNLKIKTTEILEILNRSSFYSFEG